MRLNIDSCKVDNNEVYLYQDDDSSYLVLVLSDNAKKELISGLLPRQSNLEQKLIDYLGIRMSKDIQYLFKDTIKQDLINSIHEESLKRDLRKNDRVISVNTFNKCMNIIGLDFELVKFSNNCSMLVRKEK